MATRRTWTPEDEIKLREIYALYENSQLLEFFPGKTAAAIKSKAKILGLSKDKIRYLFSELQLQRLKEIYANTRTEDIAIEFGFPIYTIYNKAYELNLKKSAEFVADNARANFTDDHPARKFTFKQGHVPENKGKQQADFMTHEAIERTKQTRFKPGQKVWNAKPIGYERVNVDGYIEVKVEEPNVFRAKNRIVWEEHFGPIPEGHNVQFSNNIRTDCRPENLYLISRRDQLLTENGIMAIPEELKPTYNILRKLKKTITKHEQKQEPNQPRCAQ